VFFLIVVVVVSSPLPSRPLLSSPSTRFSVLSSSFYLYTTSPARTKQPHHTKLANKRLTKEVPHEHDTQATSILFLIFCGEFAHCGDQKKLSANCKRDFFEKKEKLKNWPYFEEKQVTYRHI
jgi:hypothetical protein